MDDITELDVSPKILQGIVVVCQFMHASVVKASTLYLQELSRHNYVTPTSYLELLSSYTELLNKKKGSLTEGIGRLRTGIQENCVGWKCIFLMQVWINYKTPLRK